eukprot:2083213-Rhodomonas_salina.3
MLVMVPDVPRNVPGSAISKRAEKPCPNGVARSAPRNPADLQPKPPLRMMIRPISPMLVSSRTRFGYVTANPSSASTQSVKGGRHGGLSTGLVHLRTGTGGSPSGKNSHGSRRMTGCAATKSLGGGSGLGIDGTQTGSVQSALTWPPPQAQHTSRAMNCGRIGPRGAGESGGLAGEV